mgnify:CR=1 FL=1
MCGLITIGRCVAAVQFCNSAALLAAHAGRLGSRLGIDAAAATAEVKDKSACWLCKISDVQPIVNCVDRASLRGG